MELPDFNALRAGLDRCPSDLTLDRLRAGSLAAAEREAAEAHLDGCADCAARLEAFTAGFAALPEVDPRPLLAGIRRRLDEPAPGLMSRLRAGWRRWRFAALPVAAAAAAALIFWIQRGGAPDGPLPDPRDGPEITRIKGTLALHVHRLGPEGSEQMFSGQPFAPTDRLRFMVDLPAAGHVSVLGVEADGALYTAWPLPAHQASTRRGPGDGQTLEGAVQLDGAAGRETLYLVHCPDAAPRCEPAGPGAAPRCPEGCRLTEFVVNKR